MTPTTKYALGGVGAAGIISTVLGLLLARKTAATAQNAVEGKDADGVPVLPPGAGINIPVRLTGYWPFEEGLSAKERLMEGGHKDRLGKRLYTLEDYQAGKAPYVSVAADWRIFPYGQRVAISNWPGVLFRIVDTGGNFFGAKKVFRVQGHEPFDICVASRDTKIYPKVATATIFPGDDLAAGTKGPKTLQEHRIGKPDSAIVGCGFDLLGLDA